MFASESSPPILIGEVQWSGSSRSTADEWLELWNVGAESLDLAGWSLVGASEKPIYFTSTTVLAPQQTLLIANYSATAENTLLTAQTIAIATSSLSLSNDHLLIELRDQSGSLRDTIGTNARPPAGASAPVNTSMIRIRSNTGWDWVSATTSFALPAPDLGTPGICDSCQPAGSNAQPPSPHSTSSPPLESGAPSNNPQTETVEPTEIDEEPVEEMEPGDDLLLDPDEAALYGVTSTDALEEQSDSSDPSIHESTPLGTSTSTLPELQETSSSTTTSSTTSSAESVALETTSSTPSLTTTSTVTVASSTEALIPPPATTQSVIAVSTPAPTIQAPISISFDPVITEIMAAPATSEPEWVELRLPDTASPLRYLDWKLEADGKTIFPFTTTTIQALNPQGNYFLLAWNASKLKNTGALLRLKRADGTIAQEIRYATSTKGMSWIRDESSASWKQTRTPTKGLPNIFEAIPPAPVTQQTVKAVSPAIVTAPKKTITETKSVPKPKEPAAVPPKSTGAVKSLELAAKTTSSKSGSTTTTKKPAAMKETKAKATTTAKKTPAKVTKKATTKTSLILPTSVTHFEQIPPEQLSPKVRVRLQGLVGSTVGVFGKQKFVLLAPDGRGLLVKTTTDQPSPELGATIEITGQLFANDEGVQLQMQAGDTWKTVALTTTSTPRLVDWNAPGLEDQWSLTRLEGLVTDSKSSAIVLESQIGEVTIPIKAIVGYRAQRIKTGDTVEVSGIFDGRSGLWKIQPSRASDIVLLRHPEPETKTAATSPSSTKMPWNAIGIAIGSIGAVEGIRRWLEKRKATLQAKGTPATILGA